MKVAALSLIACVALAGCARVHAADRPDAPSVVGVTALEAMRDAQISALVMQRRSLPEMRDVAAGVLQTAASMHADLSRIAQRRGFQMPASLDEKGAALVDNLQNVSGANFEQGYALAVVEDMKALSRSFDSGPAQSDPDLQQFAAKYRPLVAAQQRAAEQLLDHMGGSPWPGTLP